MTKLCLGLFIWLTSFIGKIHADNEILAAEELELTKSTIEKLDKIKNEINIKNRTIGKWGQLLQTPLNLSTRDQNFSFFKEEQAEPQSLKKIKQYA